MSRTGFGATILLDSLEWPSDERALLRDAWSADETELDRTAIKHAREARNRIREQKNKFRELISDDDRKNIV